MATTYSTVGPTVDSPFTGVMPYLRGSKDTNTGFGSASTAAQVVEHWDGAGKVAIVTGANTGLGAEAARALASKGCEVIIPVRDTGKGDAAAAKIREQQPNASVSVMQLDLSSLASVQAFVKGFKATGKPLHILMANAGIMACPFMLSADGLEMQFATNHLGHFALVNGLLDTMLDTATAGNTEGRIVVLSSSAHFGLYTAKAGGPVRFDDLNSPKGYKPWPAYGQSKLCNILFTRELNKRLQGKPVVAACCHPGVIADTDLSRHMGLPGPARALMSLMFRPVMKSIPQGVATQVLLATAPGIKGGEYYSDCRISGSSTASHDAALGAKLWALSEKLCNDKSPQ